MTWASCYTPDFRAASATGPAGGTTALNDRRLCESVQGTPTIVADSIDTGRYALRCDVGAATTNIGLTALISAGQYIGGLCRFRIANGAFTTNCQLMRFAASTVGETILIRVNTTGVIAYSFNNGTSFTNSGTTIVAGQVYRLEGFVDFGTGTTHTLKIRVNGVEIVNTTGGTATSSASNVQFGPAAIAASMIVDYSDMVTYNDPAQYGALADWRVYGIEPTADGTHSMTANDFQDEASTNLSNTTTTSWSKVNDAPGAAPDTAHFVKQVVIRTTAYMEWVLRSTLIPTYAPAPVLVCLAAAVHPVGGNLANQSQFKLNSGGNISSEGVVDASIATDTLEYRKHHYQTEPGGAAWTTAKANALKARFGNSGDVSPPPALDSIMAFVVCDYAPVGSPPIGAQQI